MSPFSNAKLEQFDRRIGPIYSSAIPKLLVLRIACPFLPCKAADGATTDDDGAGKSTRQGEK
jgi:hypothetical protein